MRRDDEVSLLHMLDAAWCSGVSPSLSRASTPAPATRRIEFLAPGPAAVRAEWEWEQQQKA